MKTCAKCNIIKSLEEFPKKKSTKDGLYPYCKICKRSIDNENYQKNKEKKLKVVKQYYENNKARIKEKNAQNADKRRAYNKKWHQENRGEALERMRRWRQENQTHRQEYKKLYRSLNKEKTRQNYKDWLNNNPIAKVAKSCRSRIREILNSKNLDKKLSFSQYIGCTGKELITYIENKFHSGMSWDNYGNWHIDHIVPLSVANTEDQVYKLCHYTNLAPVWSTDNITKNNKLQYTVKPITKEEVLPYVLNIHYAKRIPNIKYSFGLFANDLLVGIITYGPPTGPSTAKALVGDEYKSNVLELNRLCLKNNLKNEASILVSKSLKLLPKNTIVLSFADSSVGHIGYVYQATNFKYYGTTEAKREVALKSNPTKHALAIYDESKGQENRAEYLKNKYGDDIYYKTRSVKHRYVYIVGNNSLYSVINYKELPYPKRT